MNVITAGDEATLRLSIFLTLFLVLAIAERLFPRRHNELWLKRWISNLSLSALNTLCLRFLTPWSATLFAFFVIDERASLFGIYRLPTWLSIVSFVLIFDMAIYFQHRLFHALGPLWIFHRVHHTDVEYDVTTGTRFHPVSILVSMIIKLLLVLLLAPLPIAVMIAEVLLNGTSMFNHSNIRLPHRIEKALRYVIVTPDMHRIHHSKLTGEHGSNFGFNFPWWDRLFGSYLESAKEPQTEMRIGINGFGVDSSIRLDRLLLQPIQKGENEN